MLQKHMKLNACGSGIGLSISKMIAESLGGKISVKSEEGEWTEFKFTIKLQSDNFMIREEVKEFEMLHHEEVVITLFFRFDDRMIYWKVKNRLYLSKL